MRTGDNSRQGRWCCVTSLAVTISQRSRNFQYIFFSITLWVSFFEKSIVSYKLIQLLQDILIGSPSEAEKIITISPTYPKFMLLRSLFGVLFMNFIFWTSPSTASVARKFLVRISENVRFFESIIHVEATIIRTRFPRFVELCPPRGWPEQFQSHHFMVSWWQGSPHQRYWCAHEGSISKIFFQTVNAKWA